MKKLLFVDEDGKSYEVNLTRNGVTVRSYGMAEEVYALVYEASEHRRRLDKIQEIKTWIESQGGYYLKTTEELVEEWLKKGNGEQ